MTNIQNIIHSILNSNSCLFTELLKESELLERENDDEFRNGIRKLYDYILNIVRTEPGPKYKLSNSITFEFTELPKSVGASYNHLTNTIKMNILLNKELYEKSPVEFLENWKMQIFHELVHLVDYSRGCVYCSHSSVSGIETPAEWNGYFHTFIHIFEEYYARLRNTGLPVDESFSTAFGQNVNEFIQKFWKFVVDTGKNDGINYEQEIQNADMKFKWNKRLYQTYFEKKLKYKEK
jgi:hypothetical protein